MNEAENIVGQFQVYQQQLQSILIQKESLRLQIMEIDRALDELNKTTQANAYKIAGQIMISKPVKELKKELEETKDSIDIRIKSLEKAEERMNAKIKELQEKIKEVVK
jgi:prefoldin beta subunit